MHADPNAPQPQRIEGAGTDDPLDRVLQLGASDRRRALSLALAAALVAHGGMAGAIRLRGEDLQKTAMPLGAQELSIERELPPPPPPTEPEPPLPPPPEPPPIAPNVTAAAPNPSENPYDEPASAPAQAGEVLVQDSDDLEETDDDENTFVTGDAGAYAGGMTASGGTSTVPVYGSVAADGGVPGGTGTPALPPPKKLARDLSRGAWLDGSTSWDDCDFPGEAERDHIRDAVVEIAVTVRPNGTAQSVEVVEDPGHGFARTASACALKHTFAPALDAEGRKDLGADAPIPRGFPPLKRALSRLRG